MIESGLFQFATQTAAISSLMAPPAAGQKPSAFYFSRMLKASPLPLIVMHRVASPPEILTLEPMSTQPGIIRGRFQFESYAQDGTGADGLSPSGYLAAAALSRALRLQLQAIPPNAPLPDGTMILNSVVNDEFDANFEEGGIGYVYRRILDVNLWFQEQAS